DFAQSEYLINIQREWMSKCLIKGIHGQRVNEY
ncbi:hypothetical protein VCHE40_1571, partial [Vibrio cholerae HE-40]